MQLYELVLNEGRSVSPFVWRAKMALAHKGFAPETVAIGYGDKAMLAVLLPRFKEEMAVVENHLIAWQCDLTGPEEGKS